MKTMIRAVMLVAALLIVTAIPARAGQGVGSSPYTADLLVSGLNTGKLDPGQEYWYAYSRLDMGDPAYNSVILSLNFEAEGRAIASRVNFQVFNFEQVEAWLKDSSGPVDSLGLGAPASADFDINTGERFWAGAMSASEVYYVRIFNLSPSPVQFRLTALGQKGTGLEAFMAFDQASSANESGVIPAALSGPSTASPAVEAVAPVPPGLSSIAASLPVQPNDGSVAATGWLLAAQAINGLPPYEAAAWLMSAAALGWLPSGNASSSLVPVNPNPDASPVTGGGGGGGDTGAGEVAAVPVDPNAGNSIYPNQPLILKEGTNTGRLAPKSEHWYTFTPAKLDGKLIENMSLTMFFTPGEPNIARQVTFEMFTGSQYYIWDRGTPDDMEHFGAGSWISRDGDYNSGERLWHGAVVDGDKYFVKITNGTDEWIDYYLITGDIINIEMGPPTSKEPGSRLPFVATIPTGKDIGSPLPIATGHKRGTLPAGEEVWFTFEHKNNNPDRFENLNYIIELRHTPGAGYVTNHVNVELYPYPEQQIWRRGDTDQIKPLGAGSDFEYDKSTGTHTWIWNGHLASNTTYFVRVRNGSTRDIDYDLFIQQRR